MLQRVARRALKSHHVLINAVLVEDVLVEVVVISQAAAEAIVIPDRLALHPRVGADAETHPLLFPFGARILPGGGGARAVFRSQRIELEAGRQVTIEEIQRALLPGIDVDRAFQ